METAHTLRSSEHVEFDKTLNQAFEIGPEVEQYVDREKPAKHAKKPTARQRPPLRAIREK